ncbi:MULTISPECIES: bifunctional UDP-N-acetylglucosamine diphosphorylase/glucosamine-1-phosphate N-acetyltransferase GlmU [Gammaproteobacteria]|uniref:bifunctional UDP-N-acetylglucosamine diphosphorylase/glucosamine-1-phosphate N-acetyltransferase GlmU n=1 Tax=Gammaproteobacteria TaxID=1236 RepID=UPI000DCF69AC|nr:MULTISPECIES: bifunctional UDP-N-acetylglucosamine diphosphorylase/glucosamine-1-phosphate N-acetyltransferase GlmU [Gammaproteobacteria]RTE86713.1 UDP-N-acetylglucosamine diphosphorylase/glucosamine-1-phosphate N-acetyltransferase [Aliidiomarina sp. B3213]TCZ90733.1 UDP-N-acetylglucosamine diphosphorylase/glucosamine-1-phosphate N-acetyltransferase [Lysobacter sp. N42]
MSANALNVVILAAGKGTRMRSNLPKVLHPVAQKPMVAHVIDSAKKLGAENIQLIYGHGGELLQQRLSHYAVNWVEQKDQLGTGHAVQQAIPHIADDENVLVLYGDVPLTRVETLEALLAAKGKNELALLTVNLQDPTGYGRILRNSEGKVTGIVEHKDATPEQHRIQEVNTGILAANGKSLKKWLSALDNNNVQGEYYLTDIVAMAANEGVEIASAQPQATAEVEGANNRVQLAALERAYQARLAEQLMLDGATLIDPARVDVRGEVSIANDVVVDVNVVFEGKVELGEGVVIEPNCILRDCKIGDGARIKANSIVEGAELQEGAQAGPFARLRPGAKLEKNAAVGNFVEMKKSTLGEGAKAGHLTYLGDAIVGAGANIGAGTITCNYDGVNKHATVIGEKAFIGSNSSLVAPVNIGHGSTTGAGSVVTADVPDNTLAVGRAKQRNITGWKRPEKKSGE